MEKAVAEVHFEALHVFQPSFITREKDRKERRPMQKVMECGDVLFFIHALIPQSLFNNKVPSKRTVFPDFTM
jgi:hypothetical protein